MRLSLHFTFVFLLGIALTTSEGLAQTGTDKSKSSKKVETQKESSTHSDDKSAKPTDQSDEAEQKDEAADSKKKEPIGGKLADAVYQAEGEVKKVLGQSEEARKNSKVALMGIYSPISMWIPGKLGAELGYVSSERWTYAFEYTKASYPVLSEYFVDITETRFALRARYFPGNSFNLSYGISYADLAMAIGSKMLNYVSSGDIPYVKFFSLKSYELEFGIGNRWQFEKGFTVGADWLVINQPVYSTVEAPYLNDQNIPQNEKDSADTFIKVMKYMPRFTLAKITLGWSF